MQNYNYIINNKFFNGKNSEMTILVFDYLFEMFTAIGKNQ